jgi:Uma2 family endonuclease
MQLANPPMSGAWTVEHLDADGIRREIFDGTLVVPPLSSGLDVMTARKLERLLEPMAPEDTITGRRFGLLLRGEATFCVPDLMVFRPPANEGVYGIRPEDVVLVVEVLSAASRRIDLVLKRHEYAAAGIPDYWVLDRQARRLTVFGLEPGRSEYSVQAEVDAGTTYRTNRPFAVEFDPAAVC